MKRTLRALGLAAALTAGAAGAARADDGLVNQQFCGGNTFSTCAFINASSSTVGGNTVLKLLVTNPTGNNAGSVFTAIGIANLPSGASVTSGTSSSANFAFAAGGPSGLNGAGIESDVVGFDAVVPPSQTGLKPGQSVTFFFTFNGAFDLGTLQYALHDQGGGPADCASSTKLVIGSGEGGYAANSPTCGPPVTTVPEPASMTLLASGLLSLGGAGAVRRRNKKSTT